MENKFTKQQWIEALTAEVTIKFWGETYSFKPVICSEPHGDGEKLVWISSIDQRPYYWLMFVDSNLDASVDIDDEQLCCLIDMVEDEFGSHPYSEGIDLNDEDDFNEYLEEYPEGERYYDTFEDYLEACKYPNIHWEGGCVGTIANFKTGEYDDCYLEEVEEYFNNEIK